MYDDKYSDKERRNLAQVKKTYRGDGVVRSIDEVAEVYADNIVYWNGCPPPPDMEQVNITVGKKQFLSNMKVAVDNTFKSGDYHDLSTARYEDILLLADGDYVVRHTIMIAKTHGGGDWVDSYCWIYRFTPEGQIDLMIQHSNVLSKYRTIHRQPLGFPFQTVQISNRGYPQLVNPADPAPHRE
jgi:hypothetical protein